jgi:PIN domain nuclease of toxin-antitoxin system
LIVATARIYDFSLVTADTEILAYSLIKNKGFNAELPALPL